MYTQIISTALVLLLLKKKIIKTMGKRIWVKEWIKQRDRISAGSTGLITELGNDHKRDFLNFVSMDIHVFNDLVKKLTPIIGKQNTKLRKCISVENKLAVILRYITTDETFTSLQSQFRMGISTISTLIPIVLNSIYSVLKEEYMKVSIFSLNYTMY